MPRRSRCSVRTTFSGLLVLAAVTLATGCNSGPQRSTISGKVTFDGEPVANGVISFEPQGAGARGSAYIKEGAYATDPNRSPSPGNYIVRITAERPSGKKVKDTRSGEMVDVIEQYIPEKYNDLSELKIEVGNESEVTKDFELTSK